MELARRGQLESTSSGRVERPDWVGALRAYLAVMAAGNFIWEAAHLPLYTIWTTGTFREQAFAVVHCTGGDLLIALSSLSIALVLAGDRGWPGRSFWPVLVLTVLFGVAYTTLSEWLNIVLRKSWAYSDLMPVHSGVRLRRRPLASSAVDRRSSRGFLGCSLKDRSRCLALTCGRASPRAGDVRQGGVNAPPPQVHSSN